MGMQLQHQDAGIAGIRLLMVLRYVMDQQIAIQTVFLAQEDTLLVQEYVAIVETI